MICHFFYRFKMTERMEMSVRASGERERKCEWFREGFVADLISSNGGGLHL